MSRPAELQEWHRLLQESLLTQDEFAAIKAKLMAVAFDPIVAEQVIVQPRQEITQHPRLRQALRPHVRHQGDSTQVLGQPSDQWAPGQQELPETQEEGEQLESPLEPDGAAMFPRFRREGSQESARGVFFEASTPREKPAISPTTQLRNFSLHPRSRATLRNVEQFQRQVQVQEQEQEQLARVIDEKEEEPFNSEEERDIKNQNYKGILRRWRREVGVCCEWPYLDFSRCWIQRLVEDTTRSPQEIKEAILSKTDSHTLMLLLCFSALVPVIAEIELDMSATSIGSAIDIALFGTHIFMAAFAFHGCFVAHHTATSLIVCNDANVRTFMTGIGGFFTHGIQMALPRLWLIFWIWTELFIAHHLKNTAWLGSSGELFAPDARWYVHVLLHLMPVIPMWGYGTNRNLIFQGPALFRLVFHGCIDLDGEGPVCPQQEMGLVQLTREEAMIKIMKRARVNLHRYGLCKNEVITKKQRNVPEQKVVPAVVDHSWPLLGNPKEMDWQEQELEQELCELPTVQEVEPAAERKGATAESVVERKRSTAESVVERKRSTASSVEQKRTVTGRSNSPGITPSVSTSSMIELADKSKVPRNSGPRKARRAVA